MEGCGGLPVDQWRGVVGCHWTNGGVWWVAIGPMEGCGGAYDAMCVTSLGIGSYWLDCVLPLL